MQTVNNTFDKLSKGYARPVNWNLSASFDKTFDDTVEFFTLDESILDGSDVLAPTDNNVVQEWDKYEYTSYHDRVISMEVTREESEPYSIAQSYADVTLNNYDGFFTPNNGSPIQDYILPRRPFRIGMGFGIDSLQQIVGLSDSMPEIDKSDRTASFHIIDFMSFLLSKDIGETIILENKYTNEILAYLLDYMGLSAGQYALDSAYNKVGFFYVEKGTKFDTVVRKLIEAEMGRFYMDELGIIRFKNRYNYDLTPVLTFNSSNIINYEVSDESLIINSVRIKSDVRRLQPLQSVWTSIEPTRIEAGATVDVWANFSDPVTTSNLPVPSDIERPDSYFSAFRDEESSLYYGNVTLTGYTQFSKSAKLTFTNTGADLAYINAIEIYGTPAKVVDTILVEQKDQTSIDKYDEQLYEIENQYIQDEDMAVSRALTLIRDYKEYGSSIQMEVKGSPALQLGDPISISIDGYSGTYMITKITNILADGQFKQRIRAVKKDIPSFFTLDDSVLDGDDVLAP